MSLGGHFRAIKINIKTKPVMQAALSVTPKTQNNSFPSKLILLLYTSPIMSVMSINLKINIETNRDNNGKHIHHFDNKYYILRKKSFEGPGLWYCESASVELNGILQGVREKSVWNYSHQWLRISWSQGSNKLIRHNFMATAGGDEYQGLFSKLKHV